MRAISGHVFMLLSCFIGLASTHYQHVPTATIGAGLIVGKTTSLPAALGPVNQFLGVPFAKSPPERFSPPQPHARFREPLNATAVGPACFQQFRCIF
jgi:carboxylesterase type B